MTETFEKLKRIAKEEFGCELVEGEQKLNFKDVFGIDIEELKDDKET